MLVVVGAHALQDLLERWQVVARLFGKISAAEEGAVLLGLKKHGQRPAAVALGEQRLRGLVDLVNVGAFPRGRV